LIHQCRLFFIALQFFTRLPIPGWVGFDPAWLHQASRYFPLVGLLVGAVGAAVYAAAGWLWPAPVAALLSTAATIYLTGAFHEDGFADMCDGFGGGLTRQRVLEIMKDSRIGSYGAVALVLLLGLKVLLLSLLAPQAAIAALLLAHPVSRLAAAMLIHLLDYAREEGKAKPMAHAMTRSELAIAAVCTGVPACVLAYGGWLSWFTLAAAMSAAGVATWLGAKCVKRIGGYTGDCLGAVQQLAEVAVYLCVLGAAAQGVWH
jgi:adenosylcobinamide-GDP ribazoletransferase